MSRGKRLHAVMGDHALRTNDQDRIVFSVDGHGGTTRGEGIPLLPGD
jgi:hypothetical protein